MKKIAYCGLDPGKSGFITVITEVDGVFKESFFPMPEHDVETGKVLKNGKMQTKPEFFEGGFIDLVFEIKKAFPEHEFKVAIELVIGRAGWSATNNFNFGYAAGLQRMIFIMLRAEITLVRPAKWQSFMRQGHEEIRKASKSGKTMVMDPKAVAEAIVQKEFSHVDFRKTERARNNDDNKIDSFLLAHYRYRIDNK